MKSLLLAISILGISSFAHASEKLCPQGTDEVTTCVADGNLPFYPFAAVCKSESGFSIVLDPGAGKSPDVMPATLTDSAESAVFTATDEDAVTLSVEKKTGAREQKAVLSYKLMVVDMKDSLTCSNLAD